MEKAPDRSASNLQIRYDGKDADRHEIELHALGESLQGMARIIGVTGHFIATGRYARKLESLDVKVYVAEPRANCYSLQAGLQFIESHPVLISSIVAPLMTALITWIFARFASNQSDRADKLLDALTQLQLTHARERETTFVALERVAESLRPATLQAISPIGSTCSSLTVGPVGSSAPGEQAVVDEFTAEVIRHAPEFSRTEVHRWLIHVSEVDRSRSSAKVRILNYVGEGRRITARLPDQATFDQFAQILASRTPVITVDGNLVYRRGKAHSLHVLTVVTAVP